MSSSRQMVHLPLEQYCQRGRFCARAGTTEQNLNNVKSSLHPFFKKPKIGEDYPRNPKKASLRLGKNEEEISSAWMMIACEFLDKSTVKRS